MLLVKPNNKYSHCYFLRDVPGLMLLIILFMFHTVEQKFDHIDQPQVSLFVCVQTAQKAKKTIWGLGEDGESQNVAVVIGYKLLFLRGGYSTRNCNHCFVLSCYKI